MYLKEYSISPPPSLSKVCALRKACKPIYIGWLQSGEECRTRFECSAGRMDSLPNGPAGPPNGPDDPPNGPDGPPNGPDGPTNGLDGPPYSPDGPTNGPVGPTNGPVGPPNGPDSGAGDRRLRPWYLTRGWIMSHLYL